MLQWTDLAWPMLAAACLTLGAVHLAIALQHHTQRKQLLLTVSLFSVGAVALIELMMLRATTPDEYSTWLRWVHVPVLPLMVSVVLFVGLQFQAGRWWLGALACLVRGASLLANFVTGESLNFLHVSALRQVDVGFGASVAAPVGDPNPWMFLGSFSLFLLVCFLIDVLVTVFRRGSVVERAAAVRVCGSIAAGFLVTAVWFLVVVFAGVGPLMATPPFFGMVLMLSYELGGDVLRAGKLAQRLNAATTDLHDSELRMEFAESTAGIGLWHWDLVADEITLSPAAQQVLGLPPGEAFNRDSFRARIAPADLEGLLAVAAKARQGEGLVTAEFKLHGADGGRRWIAARGQTVFDCDRNPQRMRGVVIDVTDKRHADEHFRLVFAGAPIAMLMVAADGCLVLANPQAAAIFGHGIDALQGMHIEDLIPADRRAQHVELRRNFAAFATQRLMKPASEVFALRQDGSLMPVEVTLNPIQFDSELLVIAAISDLSQRRQLERQSAFQREELAHLSRVAMLAELSGSLAHELNQPLTAILSNAQAALRFMAHQPPNLAEVREALVNVVDSDKRAGEVIRRLRAMLRREAPAFVQLDLNEVVHEVLRIIRGDLIDRNVRIVEDLAPGLPMILGDRVQLQQVILNLLMNGSDAMREIDTGRQLTLTSELADGGVQLHVADVGHGIPEADLERIFAPFVSTKADGMGIGLALCTTLIQAHSGRLWATNNVDRGATLHVHLPIADSP